MVQPTRTAIQAEAYFQLPEYAKHDLIQLINGEVVIGIPPVPAHQDIVGDIFVFLKGYVKQHGGKTYTAPIEVYLDEDNVYEPDILYIFPDSACTVEEKRLIGAPDLVVEVLSPSTARYDRREKYNTYEKHSVREYWIVDPVHKTLEVSIHQSGQFQRLNAYSTSDTFTSPLLNVTVPVKDFFASA